MAHERDSGPDPAEAVQRLEAENKRFQKKIDDLGELAEKRRQRIETLENDLEKERHTVNGFRSAIQQKNRKIEAYTIFTHLLMIVLTWVAVPVLCYKIFRFSPMVALLVGFVVYVGFLVMNETFVRDIRGL